MVPGLSYIENLLNENTLEDTFALIMHYYLLLFLAVGVLLLIVLIYRTFRILKNMITAKQAVKTSKKVSMLLLIVPILIQFYLAGALLAAYILLALSKWETTRFLFPYDFLLSFHQTLLETSWFSLIALVIVVFFVMLSLIFLLGALARLLGSEKDRFQGQEGLTLAFLVSLIPIVLFWQQ